MEERNLRKTMTGVVTSDKMDKTVVIAVVQNEMDKTYGKIKKRTYKLKAHDENNECKVGDKVKLENGCIPTLIRMPGDTQTLAAKQKIHREGKSIVGVGTVKFSEFVLVDEYSIVGVWIESPAINN